MEKETINREAISSTDVRINADSIGTVEKRLVCYYVTEEL